MATYTGHDGTISFTGGGQTDKTIVNMRNFSIEQTQDTIENTVMSANGSRTYVPGLSTYTISGDVFWDGSDATGHFLLGEDFMNHEGADSSITFKVFPSGSAGSVSNTKFEGSAILTSFSITSTVDGMVEASFTAQGTGTLAVDLIS